MADYTTLVSAIESSKLNDVRYVDCRFDLSDPEAGQRSYDRSHIPGAIYADLDHQLASPIVPGSGRHPLPNIKDFRQWLESVGLTKSQQIIIYDNLNGAYAARLWWMLSAVGYTKVGVMEGGYHAWQTAGLPVTTELPSNPPVPLDAFPDSWSAGMMPFVEKEQVLQYVENRTGNLVDSRAPERYKAESEVLDPIAGHIKTARNHYWAANLDENGYLLNHAVLQQQFDEIMSDQTVFYCGSGVSACFNILVAKHLGYATARLYPGSWSEWIRHYPEIKEP